MSERYASDHHNTRLETYYKSGRIMLNMSQSIGRLVTAGRDINKLAAYTQRVSDLFDKMQSKDSFEKHLKNSSARTGQEFAPFSGELKYSETEIPFLELKNVPLVTPTGETLIRSLSFRIEHLENIIITGPNGSGKSSLFRTISELWPLYGGEMTKSKNSTIFYVPQKPYLALGTLRDQIIYPQLYEDMKKNHKSDRDLMEILRIVELEYLLERESFDSVQDWSEILSGGEKQRIALGRLIYHKPQFAFLDECTSAVSADFEQNIYRFLVQSSFCSLISVSHRIKQLQKFHHYRLGYVKDFKLFNF